MLSYRESTFIWLCPIRYSSQQILVQKESPWSPFSLGDKYCLSFAGTRGNCVKSLQTLDPCCKTPTLHETNFSPSTCLQKFCGLTVLVSSCSVEHYLQSPVLFQRCYSWHNMDSHIERLLEAACIVPAGVIFRFAIWRRDEAMTWFFYLATSTWVHAFNNLFHSCDF